MSKQETRSDWSKTLDIPSSAITFAAGGSSIGAALAGPGGSLVGAVVGAVCGVIAEVASQKIHRAEGEKRQRAQASE